MIGPLYADFIRNAQYIAKKRAEAQSYLWDRLIEQFTTHMLDGTSIVLPGFEYDLRGSELAVHYMALETRLARRSHSSAVGDAIEMGLKRDVFFRAMLPEASKGAVQGTAFFVLTLKYLPWMEKKGGYERCRQMRTHYGCNVVEQPIDLRRLGGREHTCSGRHCRLWQDRPTPSVRLLPGWPLWRVWSACSTPQRDNLLSSSTSAWGSGMPDVDEKAPESVSPTMNMTPRSSGRE